MKNLCNLNLLERQAIYRLRSNGVGIREIARRLRRCPSTISRELKRNAPVGQVAFLDVYSKAKHAQDLADKRKHQLKGKRRLKSSLVRGYVVQKIKEKRTPRDISHRIKVDHPGESISHEAIYQFIYSERRDLIEYLPQRKRSRERRKNKKSRRGKVKAAAKKRSIAQRPDEVEKRQRFGDWEGDTVVSRQSKPCIFTLTERKSRFTLLHKLSDCTAESAYNALITSFYQIPPELKHTLTLDNGPENSCHDRLTLRCALDVYFCEPYSSWQRGSVENVNGILRRFWPKKTDLGNITQEELSYVQDWINTRHMECLNGKTPAQLFLNEIEKYPNPLNVLFPGTPNITQSFLIAA